MRTEFRSRVFLSVVVLAMLAAGPAVAQRDLFDIEANRPGGGLPPPAEFAGTYMFQVDNDRSRTWLPVLGLMTLNADGCATASSFTGIQRNAVTEKRTHGVWSAVTDHQARGRFLTMIHDSRGNLIEIERASLVVDFGGPSAPAKGTMVIESFNPSQLSGLSGPNTDEAPFGGTREVNIELLRLALN